MQMSVCVCVCMISDFQSCWNPLQIHLCLCVWNKLSFSMIVMIIYCMFLLHTFHAQMYVRYQKCGTCIFFCFSVICMVYHVVLSIADLIIKIIMYIKSLFISVCSNVYIHILSDRLRFLFLSNRDVNHHDLMNSFLIFFSKSLINSLLDVFFKKNSEFFRIFYIWWNKIFVEHLVR